MSMGAVLDMCGASCASHLATAHLDPLLAFPQIWCESNTDDAYLGGYA